MVSPGVPAASAALPRPLLTLCLALLGCSGQKPAVMDGREGGPPPDLAAEPGLPPDLRPRDGGRDPGPPDGRDGGTSRLRIMAANLTSGNDPSYDSGEGIRIFQGLRPDVVLIQEMNYRGNSDADLRAFVDTAFGAAFSYYREPGANIPNGVVSRYPILAAGVWDDPATSDRDVVWARLDVPGPRDLWAVSVHLLTASATTRNNQARSLLEHIEANVPANDYLVVGGDFNTDGRNEPCLGTLARVLVTEPPAAPYPVDQNGNGNTNASRAKPYDWVLADADLNPLRVPVQVGASVYRDGLVFDSRVYTPLSEVAPVRQGDSGAKNMQHMAVVKDFALPN